MQEKRVSRLEELKKMLFLEVRDMLFEVIPGTSVNYRKAIESIEKYRKGSCTSKHFYLGKIYSELFPSSKILYITFIFYWEEQDYISSELMKLAKKLPEQFHLALDVDGRLIDGTYDSLLAPIFPVNEYENCKVSVRYVDKVVHSSPQERIEYIIKNAKKSHYIRKFYTKLNRYCRRIRKSNIFFVKQNFKNRKVC